MPERRWLSLFKTGAFNHSATHPSFQTKAYTPLPISTNREMVTEWSRRYRLTLSSVSFRKCLSILPSTRSISLTPSNRNASSKPAKPADHAIATLNPPGSFGATTMSAAQQSTTCRSRAIVSLPTNEPTIKLMQIDTEDRRLRERHLVRQIATRLEAKPYVRPLGQPVPEHYRLELERVFGAD